MANIYDILMGSPPQANETAQAMAEQIRRGRAVQLAGALGSDNAIGAMGGVVGAHAKQDQDLMEKAAATRAHYGEEAKQRDFMLKMALAQMKGGPKAKPLPPSERKALIQLNTDMQDVAKMQQTFKPEFAGLAAGDTRMWASKGMQSLPLVGAMVSPHDRERNLWWTQFRRLVEIPTRHKFFGSAFTKTEEEAFNRANAITPNSRPEDIQSAFNDMMTVLQNKMVLADTLKASGAYNDDEIDTASGAKRQQAAPQGGVKHLGTYDPTTGEFR